MHLPAPDTDALAASQALAREITQSIASAGGWIGFDHFMAQSLYTPGLGYYSGGAHKFGAAGDFVTAPELTPVFARTLATQVAQIMTLAAPQIIEVGAGSGTLAVDLLCALEDCHRLPERYGILELSGELRHRQHCAFSRRAPHLLPRIYWLECLPEKFDGLVLANELLDALPVHRVTWDESGTVLEQGVACEHDRFIWSPRPARGHLLEKANALHAEMTFPGGYTSEIAQAGPDWLAAWGRILGQGALLLIDYGFPRHEFYHPQRNTGTLMCHYRHLAHDDPFFLPGLQDITAHVDFTALAEAGHETGLELLGYTSQAAFLLDCGLAEVLSRNHGNGSKPDTPDTDWPAKAQAVQKLVSPAEMGELFKVMALGKGIDAPLIGFRTADRSMTL